MADPEDGAAGAPDEAFDASDKDQVDKRKRSAGRRAAAHKRVVADLLATPDGRNWVWALLEESHIFQPSFVPGDPHATAYRDGERNGGLRLMAQIPPESMMLLLKEQGNG